MTARAWVLAALTTMAAAAGCGPREKVVIMHPEGSDGARQVMSIAMTQQVTVPDNFILRPDEFAAVAVDHKRGLIYVGSREGTLLALEHDSGGVVWEMPMGGAVSSRPTIASLPGDQPRPDSLLLVGTDNGSMAAIDLDTREERWRYETSGKIRNNAIVHEGVVFFVNSRDQVFALDIRTGNWRWQYEQEFQTEFTVAGRAGLAFVPAFGDAVGEAGTLYTGFDNGRVVAIGAASGEALWIANVGPAEGGDFVDCDSTPLIDVETRELFVAGQATGVYGLSLDDGTEKWRFDVRAVTTVVDGPGRDLVAASSLEGVLALDRAGRQLWRTQVDPGVLATPVVVGSTVFVTHSESGLMAFDADTGDFLARVHSGSGMSSVPVFDPVGGRLYATTNRGLLIALRVVDHPAGADPSPRRAVRGPAQTRRH